jgi:hypothetical protein
LVEDLADGFVEGGGAGGDADGGGVAEPKGIEFIGGGDVVGGGAEGAGLLDELGGVVGVVTADDDDDFVLAGEGIEGGLAVLGGLADGIDEADFGGGMAAADLFDEGLDEIDGLGGLGDDAEAGVEGEAGDFLGCEENGGVGKVAGEALDFDVAGFADDEGVETGGDELGEGGVGFFDEGAGGVGDLVAGGVPGLAIFIGGAVGGDDDVLGGGALGIVEMAFLDAEGVEVVIDDGVVDEVTEDGEAVAGREGGSGEVMGFPEGIADAEAHAEVICESNFHRWEWLEVGGWRLAIGDWRLAIGDWRLAIGGWRLAVGGWQFALYRKVIR